MRFLCPGHLYWIMALAELSVRQGWPSVSVLISSPQTNTVFYDEFTDWVSYLCKAKRYHSNRNSVIYINIYISGEGEFTLSSIVVYVVFKEVAMN